MNKQEAIESIKKISDDLLEVKFVSLESVIDIVSQIHEPQQVVVLTKHQADYIESFQLDTYFKKTKALHYINRLGWNYGLTNGYGKEIDGKELLSLENGMGTEQLQLLLTNAIINGYEVEKEKLYTVEIPNPNDNEITVLERTANGVVLAQFGRHEDNWKKERVYCLTESEIKQDFEWAWDAGFYEPVEVE
ncbi:DUF1642 domain-containing protein [Streptococcus suis]|uniref:DUF1642 domain-containing protein n=1 Tax=Streptococcus suis TaxID=1307 RepID=UPI0038BA2895